MSTPDANGWIKGPPPAELRDGEMVIACIASDIGPTIDLVDWDDVAQVWGGYVADYADDLILYHQPAKLPVELDT